MRGSKRVPNLDIDSKGAVMIELWCNAVQGQMVVAMDTVTIITGAMTQRSCTPDQARADDALIAVLNQVTNWRAEGSALVLTGTRTLRFRVNTN